MRRALALSTLVAVAGCASDESTPPVADLSTERIDFEQEVGNNTRVAAELSLALNATMFTYAGPTLDVLEQDIQPGTLQLPQLVLSRISDRLEDVLSGENCSYMVTSTGLDDFLVTMSQCAVGESELTTLDGVVKVEWSDIRLRDGCDIKVTLYDGLTVGSWSQSWGEYHSFEISGDFDGTVEYDAQTGDLGVMAVSDGLMTIDDLEVNDGSSYALLDDLEVDIFAATDTYRVWGETSLWHGTPYDGPDVVYDLVGLTGDVGDGIPESGTIRATWADEIVVDNWEIDFSCLDEFVFDEYSDIDATGTWSWSCAVSRCDGVGCPYSSDGSTVQEGSRQEVSLVDFLLSSD